MPTEVRIYTMKPGKLDEFVEIFRRDIMTTSASYGVRIHAAWRHDAANEFVWIRSYDDEEAIEAYNGSPERARYTSQVQGCIESTDVRTVEQVVGDLPVANS